MKTRFVELTCGCVYLETSEYRGIRVRNCQANKPLQLEADISVFETLISRELTETEVVALFVDIAKLAELGKAGIALLATLDLMKRMDAAVA